MVTGWQEAAQALWGDDWIAPMAEWADINRRTIERWKAGVGEPRQPLQDRLVAIARRAGTDAQVMGSILRRMARGETADNIRAEIAAMRRSLMRIEAHHDVFMGDGNIS